MLGGEHVERIKLRDTVRRRAELPASAIFIFVGFVPHSASSPTSSGSTITGSSTPAWTSSATTQPETWNLERDPYMLETSVPGIFAAGDVRHGVVRRVASAVGQGSIAISMVHKYLETV